MDGGSDGLVGEVCGDGLLRILEMDGGSVELVGEFSEDDL